MKNVWLMAVKFLSLSESVRCVSCVTDGRAPRQVVTCRLPTRPRGSRACPLLSAVLPVHPDHLLGGALGGHLGLHLQGKRTYWAPCAPAPFMASPSLPRGSHRVSALSSSSSSPNHNPPAQQGPTAQRETPVSLSLQGLFQKVRVRGPLRVSALPKHLVQPHTWF